MKDVNVELTKILGKVMQNSYKKKEIAEIVDRIIGKIATSRNNDEEIRKLRMEFEEIRKTYYKI